MKWQFSKNGSIFTYEIFHDDRHGPGKATMVSRTVFAYSPEFYAKTYGREHPLYPALLKEGLSPIDIIMHINMFYPHGQDSAKRLREHIGKGVGRELLDVMAKEARNDGAKAMWCNDLSDKLDGKSFFDKMEFHRAGKAERYLML